MAWIANSGRKSERDRFASSPTVRSANACDCWNTSRRRMPRERRTHPRAERERLSRSGSTKAGSGMHSAPGTNSAPGTSAQPPARAPSPQHAAPSTQIGLYNPCVHRFFAPALDPGDETVALPRDEAEHLTRVLRLGIGDTVSV